MKTFTTALFLLSTIVATANGDDVECSLCPGGEEPATPDREYRLGNSVTTCRDIMNAANEADADGCWGAISWDGSFDWQTFCGCPDMDEPQYTCGDYCSDHKIEADAALPSDIAEDASCLEFAGLYPYLLDSDKCGGRQLKDVCCVNGSSAHMPFNLRLVVLIGVAVIFGLSL